MLSSTSPALVLEEECSLPVRKAPHTHTYTHMQQPLWASLNRETEKERERQRMSADWGVGGGGKTQGKGESGKLAGTLHCTATDLPALPQKPPAPSFLSLCASPVLPPNPLPCAAPLGYNCPLGLTRGGEGVRVHHVCGWWGLPDL